MNEVTFYKLKFLNSQRPVLIDECLHYIFMTWNINFELQLKIVILVHKNFHYFYG